jgi:hypothetical protein
MGMKSYKQTLLEETIPNYRLDDLEMQWPTYESYESPYVYAQDMIQQVNMARKRGQYISQRVAVKTFLKNIVDFAKKDSHGWVAVLLKDQLDSIDDDQELPPKFDLKQLAQKITTAKSQPSDVKSLGTKSGIERKVYTAAMQRQHSGTSNLEDAGTLTGKMESLKVHEHLQGYAVARYLINEVFRPNFPKSMRRPMPDPSQARKYNRPRRPYDPNSQCEACNRWGHKATKCDMLAMAIWLMEFLKRDGNEELTKEIQKYWMERNAKEQQLKPSDKRTSERTALQVMETYLDRYYFTEEQIANELDWSHFQTDYLEEPEPELPYEDLLLRDTSENQAQE